jgi:hypothetical protein
MTDDALVNGTSTLGTVGEETDLTQGLSAFAALGHFLEEDGWHPQRIDDYVYRVYFSGKNGEVACFAQVRVEIQQFLFYGMLPIHVPEHMRGVMAEYLTRANYGLRIGNFEMDYVDGEVRFKSSLDFEGEALTTNLIRNAIYPAVQTLDRYLPGALAVIYGGKAPEAAIAEIEAQSQ